MVAAGIGLGGIGLYVVLARYGPEHNDSSNSRVWPYLLGSLLICCMAWLAFALRSEQYVKPLAYYVLMAIATGLAFYGTLKSRNRTQFYMVVGIACFVGLSHIWTEHLLFPGSLIGIDPWTHQARVLEQPGLSSLLRLGGSLSLMHLYLSPAVNLLGVSYKWASLVLVGSVQTVGIIVLTFLLGRILWNEKVGCVACLMVASANWVIFFGGWIIPNSLGALYSLALVFLVLKVGRDDTRKLLAPVLLTVLVAYATGVIAAVWVLGTLACLWVLPTLLDETLSAKDKARKMGRLLVAPSLGVLVVVIASQITALGDSLRTAIDAGGFNPSYGMTTYAIGAAPTPEGAPISALALDGRVFGELVAGSLGMLLYIGLAVTGCLLALRRTTKPALKSFIVLGVAVLCIGFFPPLFGFSLIEHRWWYFAQVLLAIPLGVALVSMASHRRAIMTVVLVSVVVFLSTIGLMSNMTNRALSPNLIVRYAFTKGEAEALAAIPAHGSLVIGTDPIFQNFVNAYSHNKVIHIADEILSGDFSGSQADIIILRSALSNEPFGFGGGTIYRLEYDILALIKQQGYRKLWENKEVVCLIRRG